MIKNNKKIIVATGGTGGHIFPAVSLTNYLNKNGFETILTTDERGLKFIDKEYSQKTFLINSSPIIKKSKLISFYKIILAFFNSIFFLLKNKPKFIFGMGGYASFPICLAGFILRIPFIIYENNLYMGKANRYLTPLTRKIFVSYEDIQGINIKYKKKITVIGNILRENIINYTKTNKKKSEEILNILVLGGSQAAKIFAEKLPHIFFECKKNNINLKIYQQCLNHQKFELEKKYKDNNIDNELFSFTFNILKYYNLADVAISRAGSSALAEFLNCKIPVIAVPLPTSSENHQLKNAEYFTKKGYGVTIEEKDIKNKLFDLLHSMHKNKSMLEEFDKNQKNHSDKNVFEIIKKEITKIFYEN